ncbi:FAD-dependent oxidoreductase [Gulosibacter sediminis]|uniref:FAD-dependent oxidoreductase n=1 Tax=Gulosibacter sediminis TaxID=1729695 RepID=UPI002E2E1DE4|nr:FAD-dependent oxidoreductase [Gulosibacter sediminis]
MLALAGRSVALVERSASMFGGTCINIGCVPTKTLLHDADLHHQRGSAETAAAVEQVLADDGIALAHATELASVDAPADGPLTLHLTSGATTRELEVDALLLSTGRVPATDGLGLEAAGVEVDERGAIVVDDFLRTSADKVWAVGDVNGGPQHTYVSFDDHRIVAD